MITKSIRGGLETLVVQNHSASAEISLFGAQVLSFIPAHDKRERLWLSPRAKLDKSKPIRGGIPICWPWFGDAPDQFSEKLANLPPHGFVRDQLFELASAKELNSGCDQVVLKPKQYRFKELQLNLELEIVITIDECLSIELVTRNTSLSPTLFFAALHSYFKVDSIDSVELHGIRSEYIDKTQSMKRMPALNNYIIDTETDRIHLDTSPHIRIATPTAKTQIKSRGNDSIVVWNPWEALSKSMLDMTDNGFREMLCVETARTQQGKLGSMQSHTLQQIIC